MSKARCLGCLLVTLPHHSVAALSHPHSAVRVCPLSLGATLLLPPRFRTTLLPRPLLIMDSAACWYMRNFPDYCVCNGVSSSSSLESDVDAVNFELFHTLRPGDQMENFNRASGPSMNGATGGNRVRSHTALPGKGKGPASAALSQLMRSRLSPGGGAACVHNLEKDDQDTNAGSAGKKGKNNNVVFNELIDKDKGLAHASPFDVVVHGVPCCTKITHPRVWTMKDDGLCVVESHVRPRNTYDGAEHDGVTVVVAL